MQVDVAALAVAEPGQPKDQAGSRNSQNIAGPGAAVARTVRFVEDIEEDRGKNDGKTDLQPAEVVVDQERLVPLDTIRTGPSAGCELFANAHCWACLMTSMNCDGSTR